MKSILAMMAIFLLIGVFSRKFDNKTRLLLLVVAISVVAYVTIK
jgi:hypothetical protein